MPESTCLHIQDHESGPIRVVDIPWISVRIGRAAFCEVRLSSDNLADEACRLYRRGRSWHLVPVGDKGKILVDGRSVTAMCALPFDVTFRVGRHCLTLRQDRTVDPDWEMYPGHLQAHRNRNEPKTKDVPAGLKQTERTTSIIESQPVAEASKKPDWRPHERAIGPGSTGEYATASSVKDRWETRWRAAGAEIKARGERSPTTRGTDGPAFKAGIDSVPIKEVPVPGAPPAARPGAEPPAWPRPIPTTPPIPVPPRVAKVEPSVPIVVGRLEAESYLREQRCERGCRPGEGEAPPEPESALASLGGSPSRNTREVPARSVEPPSALQEIDAGRCDGEAPPDPVSSLASLGGSPSQDVSEGPARSIETASALEKFDADTDEQPIADESSYTTSLLDDEPHSAADEASWYEAPALPTPRQGRPPRQSPSVRKRPVMDVHTADSDRAKHALSRGKKGAERRSVESPQPRDGGEPRPIVANRPEPESSRKLTQMPSAKDILATHRSSRKSLPVSLPAGRLRQVAGPTLAREPDQWSLPAWIAGPPVVAFVLAIGLAGGILSWWWTADSYSVAIMTRLLMAADRRPQRGPLPESVAPPDGSWTRSTAQHLAHWAIFMSLTEPGKDPTPDDVVALSLRALEVTPLNPTARMALAQLDRNANAATISPRALGMSRDLVSLSWCARRLLATGNREDALKMYRKALAMLTPDEPFRSALPRFSDDPTVPRYLLPGEDRVRVILRELLSRNDWEFREWSTVLPKLPASALAAARLLKEQSKGDADVLLDLLMESRLPIEGAKRASALALAARAEAFALTSRWKDSEQSYRRAIELIDDETIKRSWWFNLADVELQLDDESQRQTALRAALAASTPDEISRRATDIQRANNNARAPIRPPSVRAN
jgi:tetratricopeptide (TPR) repeat protein